MLHVASNLWGRVYAFGWVSVCSWFSGEEVSRKEENESKERFPNLYLRSGVYSFVWPLL